LGKSQGGKMIIIPNKNEAEHLLKYQKDFHIRISTQPIKTNDQTVILFGSCGLLKKLPLNKFYVPKKAAVWGLDLNWSLMAHFDVQFVDYVIETELPVHDKATADIIRQYWPLAKIVDMESERIARFYGDRLTIVRYPIDFCEKKITFKGINWLARKLQHRRMQKKFIEILFQLNDYFQKAIE
jgi:hypothetical protein